MLYEKTAKHTQHILNKGKNGISLQRNPVKYKVVHRDLL